MKKIIIALVVVAVVSLGAYYLVFVSGSGGTPSYTNSPEPTNSETMTPMPTVPPETPTPSSTAEPTATPKASASSTPKPAPSTSGSTVTIKDFAFSPTPLTVKRGTKVTWVNNDNTSHTVSSDSDTTLESPVLSTGGTFSFTFTTPGTFSYHCSFHSDMKGTIVVTN